MNYKELEPTQVIKKGDEWFDEEDEIWYPVKTTIGTRVMDTVMGHKYRRPIGE